MERVEGKQHLLSFLQAYCCSADRGHSVDRRIQFNLVSRESINRGNPINVLPFVSDICNARNHARIVIIGAFGPAYTAAARYSI